MLYILGLLAGLLDYTLFSFLAGRGWAMASSHMLSLLAAIHFCYLLSLLSGWQKQPHAITKNYIRFLSVVLAGLFLRGGLLGLPVFSGETHIMLPAALIATSFCIWITVIVFDRVDTIFPQLNNWKKFGSLLIFYTILLRVLYLGNIDLTQEEAYYWNYSQHLASGYLDHPPVVALLIKIGTMFFGQNEIGVRIGAFLVWFVSAFFSYQLTKKIFNRETAFRSLVLMATLPIFFGSSMLMTPDAPLVACWSGALYFFYCALVPGSTRSWIGAGICLGIGFSSKYTMLFLCPAILLFMVIDPSARRWLFRPQPYLCAVIAVVIFSPVLFWNYENNWASFLFQSQGRIQAQAEFSTHILFLSILVLLTPTGALAAVSAMRPRQSIDMSHMSAWIKKQRIYIFCLTMTLTPLSIFVLFSLTREIKLNWTGPLWLSLVPFMASSMAIRRGNVQRLVVKFWPWTLVTLVFTYGLIFHYLSLGLPGIPFNKTVFLSGWDDLAQKIDNEIDMITVQKGRRPLVVGMDKYRIASGLAFYRSKINQKNHEISDINDTTGYHLFGYQDLMYSYWNQPDLEKGRDLLIVSRDKKRIGPEYFKNYCGSFTEIHEIEIKKRGKDSGHFYYRLLSGYNPEKL